MGSLPMGVILCPLAVCGDICDGRRFSLCSLSSVKSCGPAAEMSAPESGKTDVTVEPFTVLMCIVILGAGSAEVTCLSADSVFEVGSMVLSGGTCIDFAVEDAGGCVGALVWRARHTLAK